MTEASCFISNNNISVKKRKKNVSVSSDYHHQFYKVNGLKKKVMKSFVSVFI